MTKQIENQVLSATGTELLRLYHLVCNGDDGSCFDRDGNEIPERIAGAIKSVVTTIREADFPIPGEYELLLNGKRYSVTNRLWHVIWNQRHGQPYQDDLEAHVRNWRAEPEKVDVWELWDDDWAMGRELDGWWIESHLRCASVVLDCNTPDEAILRAAIIERLRKGE